MNTCFWSLKFGLNVTLLMVVYMLSSKCAFVGHINGRGFMYVCACVHVYYFCFLMRVLGFHLVLTMGL